MVVEKRAEEPGILGLEAVEKEFVMVRLPEVLGKSLILLQPLASQEVGQPSCKGIQVCQRSQMLS